MSTDQPLAADIEIVEEGHTTEDTTGRSVITPNRLRINGQSVATYGPVTIAPIGLASKERGLVTANMTLVARRLTIGAAGDIDGVSTAATTAAKSGTCDCGFEHGRPAEYDSPDRHPAPGDARCDGGHLLSDASPKCIRCGTNTEADPRREVVAKAAAEADGYAVTELSHPADHVWRGYLRRADAILAALDAHPAEQEPDDDWSLPEGFDYLTELSKAYAAAEKAFAPEGEQGDGGGVAAPATPYNRFLTAAEIRAAVAEHDTEAYRNQVRALVREITRMRGGDPDTLPEKFSVVIIGEDER